MVSEWVANILKKARYFGIEAEPGIIQALDEYLTDIGVDLRPEFLKVVAGIPVWGEEGMHTERGAGYWGPEKGISISKHPPQTGYPGPDYPHQWPERTPRSLLHEMVHRLHETMPQEDRQKVVDETVDYLARSNPLRATWLWNTSRGKNPERDASEAFVEAVLIFLEGSHEKWPAGIRGVLDDYFRFD